MSKNNSAKFAFLYLLSLVALGFVAINTGQVVFMYINKYIFDAVVQEGGYFSSSILKFAIASLVIATPIYYLASRFIYKSLYKNELDKESGVRKWLTYLIIFISFLVMIGSLIAVLVQFLNGMLGIRFILKAVTILVIAGIVFAWYFYDIKREVLENDKGKVQTIYFYASLLVVVAVFVSSLFIVESPKVARNRQIDQNIINNFNQIDGGLNSYYQIYKKLPSSLDALRAEYKYLTNDIFKNAVNQEVFQYKVLGDRDYELCATFFTDASQVDQIGKPRDSSYYNDPRWSHGIGYQCLSQKVQAINKDGSPMEIVPPGSVKY